MLAGRGTHLEQLPEQHGRVAQLPAEQLAVEVGDLGVGQRLLQRLLPARLPGGVAAERGRLLVPDGRRLGPVEGADGRGEQLALLGALSFLPCPHVARAEAAPVVQTRRLELQRTLHRAGSVEEGVRGVREQLLGRGQAGGPEQQRRHLAAVDRVQRHPALQKTLRTANGPPRRRAYLNLPRPSSDSAVRRSAASASVRPCFMMLDMLRVGCKRGQKGCPARSPT